MSAYAGPSRFFACALAAALSVTAGMAHADSTAPAYGVETGAAPANSVPLNASATAGGSAAAQASVATAPPSAPAPAAPPAPGVSPQGPTAPPVAGTPQVVQSAPVGATDMSDDDPRALEQFKPQLDQYGSWGQDPKYGQVWVPSRSVVGDDFAPYVSSGHWAMDTEDNWVWVSDYPFGDVVFHYGRWVWTSFGWSWIPGAQYAPAWVDWRVPTADYGYVGWAPMPPDYYWWGGAAVGLWWAPTYYWAFCPSRYVFARYPGLYVVHNPAYVRTIAGYTRRYTPATGRVAGPTLQTARVPRGAGPASRVATNAHFSGFESTARSFNRTTAYSSARVGGSVAYRGYGTPARAYAGPARTYGSSFSVRPYSTPHTYYPASTTLGRSYTPSAYAPRSYAPGYSPARSYSSPYSGSRVYAPASHVYSPSSFRSGPSYQPSYSAPHYSGGGGGGFHYSGGGGAHFGGGGGGAHFGGGGGGHGGGHR